MDRDAAQALITNTLLHWNTQTNQSIACVLVNKPMDKKLQDLHKLMNAYTKKQQSNEYLLNVEG